MEEIIDKIKGLLIKAGSDGEQPYISEFDRGYYLGKEESFEEIISILERGE